MKQEDTDNQSRFPWGVLTIVLIVVSGTLCNVAMDIHAPSWAGLALIISLALTFISGLVWLFLWDEDFTDKMKNTRWPSDIC